MKINTEESNLKDNNYDNEEKLQTDVMRRYLADLKELEDIKNEEEGMENEFLVANLFHKVTYEEALTALYTLCAIISAMISHETKTFKNQNYRVFCLVMVSIFNVLFIVSTVFRYKLYFKLKQATQYYIQKDKFAQSKHFKNMMIEIFFAVIGPNYGFYLVEFTTSPTWNMLAIDYRLSDIALVIMIFRIYTIFRFMIYLTDYYSSRAHRVSRMMGSKLTKLFAVRCIFYSHPVKFLITVIFALLFAFSYMLKILEGPVWKPNTNSLMNFNLLENCMWNVLVTMTTVGYGDFYPLTNLGRLISILIAIFGSILISLMTVITQSKIQLSPTEEKVFEFCLRLEARKEKEDAFTKYALSCFKYKFSSNKLKKFIEKGDNNQKEYQKLKFNLTESLYKKIQDKKQSKRSFQ